MTKTTGTQETLATAASSSSERLSILAIRSSMGQRLAGFSKADLGLIPPNGTWSNSRSEPFMRAIIGQTRSSFDFRWMIDHHQILLCDLAKGTIGDNSRLLGSLIVLKERLAASSRQNIPEASRVPHVLMVDEAQNFIGDFESILAESRKYGLSLVLATQGTESLSPEAVHAVFTNSATLGSFRVSAADAVRLCQEFGPELPPVHLQELLNCTLFVRTLKRNLDVPNSPESPSAPHRVTAYAPFDRHPYHALRDSVVRASRQSYTKPRACIDEDLRKQFFSDRQTA